jgi:hypothetical protein
MTKGCLTKGCRNWALGVLSNIFRIMELYSLKIKLVWNRLKYLTWKSNGEPSLIGRRSSITGIIRRLLARGICRWSGISRESVFVFDWLVDPHLINFVGEPLADSANLLDINPGDFYLRVSVLYSSINNFYVENKSRSSPDVMMRWRNFPSGPTNVDQPNSFH